MSNLPGTRTTTLDPNLGIVAPSADGARVVVGCSSLGAVNTVVTLSDPTTIPQKIGVGPGARGVADQLSLGGGVVHFVRTAGDILGTITPNPSNPSNPAITTSGSPLDRFEIIVKITTAGALGTSAFTYSLDGGDTVLGPIATAANVALPGTGIALNFAPGAYVVNDTYLFVTTAPKASVSSVQSAIRAAFAATNLLYEYIQVAQPTDSAFWAALAALRLEAESNHRFIDFLTETIPPGDDPDAWVAALLADIATFSAVGVHIVALWGESVDTSSGRLEIQSAAARIGARISSNQVHVSPGWGKLGALAGFLTAAPFDIVPQPVGSPRKVSKLNNGHALTLQNAGFITGFTVVGLGGYFLTRPNSAAAATSDFKFLMRSRIDEARRVTWSVKRTCRSCSSTLTRSSWWRPRRRWRTRQRRRSRR
ncbi:MAG: hypothetical protein HC933_05535 [Pleurocapsa sp. SU_196_0]|nr:hypothetical protein [Pleurocapsa sp. SU_196_0]